LRKPQAITLMMSFGTLQGQRRQKCNRNIGS
jgi:hypothetical protein